MARRDKKLSTKRSHNYKVGEDDEAELESDYEEEDDDDDVYDINDESKDEEEEERRGPVEPPTPRSAAPPKKLAVDAERRSRITAATPSDIEREKTQQIKEPEVNVEDIRKIQVVREQLLKWQDFRDGEFFEKTVRGLFVRFVVTSGHAHSQMIYRIAEIVDVREDRRTYKVDNTESSVILTLQLGQARKDFRLDSISNKPITEVRH